MFHQVLSYGSALAGIMSAGLWWWAAKVVIKRGDAKAAGNIFLGDVAIQATVKEQAKFNSWAAIATGIAAFTAALAQIF